MTEEQFSKINLELTLHKVYLQAIANKLGISKQDVLNVAETYNPNRTESKSESTNESKSEEAKSYAPVEDAPEWKIVFKVNTSEGISTQKVIQKAWTEKQAIFLGRTEQLFHTMNELVKAKQIQAKWNILDSVAEKLV